MELFAHAVLDGVHGFVDTQDQFIETPGKAWAGKGPLRLVKGPDGYGFVDREMQWVVQPELDLANKIFHDGLCRVKQDGKFGFMNLEGELVIPCEYSDAKFCVEDRILVSDDGKKFGFITSTGDPITKQKYKKETHYFKNGRAAVNVGKKWGYIDLDGKEVIKPLYRDEYGVSDYGDDKIIRGQIRVGNNGLWEFVNYDGEAIAEELQWANEFSEGLGYFWIPDEENGGGAIKSGFIDSSGEVVRWTKGFSLHNQTFSEGLIPAKPSGTDDWLHGYLDKNFEWAIEPKYRHPYPFKNGFAMVGNTDWKWTYVSAAGEQLTDFQFDMHQPMGNYKPRDFHEGCCVVYLDGKFGVLAEDGSLIVPTDCQSITDFSNGFASAKRDGKWGAFDAKGKVVVPFNYDSLGFFHPFE